MIRLELAGRLRADEAFVADVLFERDRVKVRRIELAAGARIPPCQMQEDVVFVVLGGKVTFHAEQEESLATAPAAVFIPGGAVTRSIEAHEASLLLAVLCRRGVSPEREGGPAQP